MTVTEHETSPHCFPISAELVEFLDSRNIKYYRVVVTTPQGAIYTVTVEQQPHDYRSPSCH